MRNAWSGFQKPAKQWGKTVVKHHDDPYKLFAPTFGFVVRGFIFLAKSAFFTLKKLISK